MVWETARLCNTFLAGPKALRFLSSDAIFCPGVFQSQVKMETHILQNHLIHIGSNSFCVNSCCRKVFLMVYALTQIQEYAYQTDDGRTSKNILRFTITSAMFVVRYTEIFQPDKLKATSPRAMFGAPYHSVVAHMAEMYRYISLRSVVAEVCERMFGTLR